jgi:hypothetical protein
MKFPWVPAWCLCHLWCPLAPHMDVSTTVQGSNASKAHSIPTRRHMYNSHILLSFLRVPHCYQGLLVASWCASRSPQTFHCCSFPSVPMLYPRNGT